MSRTSTTAYKRLRAAVRRRAKAQSLPCSFCGGAIAYDAPHTDPLSFELDHIVPHVLGGEDSFENSRPAHKRCNRVAGARLGRQRQLQDQKARDIRSGWTTNWLGDPE